MNAVGEWIAAGLLADTFLNVCLYLNMLLPGRWLRSILEQHVGNSGINTKSKDDKGDSQCSGCRHSESHNGEKYGHEQQGKQFHEDLLQHHNLFLLHLLANLVQNRQLRETCNSPGLASA